jgi:hypothetical protein
MLPVRMASDLFVNLRSGFKLLVCLPMRRYDVRVSLPQVLMLAAIAAAAFVVREKLTAEPGAVFIAWNLPQPAWVVLCILFCAALVSLVQGASPVGLLTAVAALAPWVIVLAAAERWLATRWPAREQLLQIGALTLLTVAIARAIVVTAQRRKIRALVTGLALSVVLVIATVWIQLDPRLWAQEDVAAADAPEDAASVDESVLYEQPDLIAQMSEQLAPQRPGVIDLYFLGFAGDGAQQIFSREVKFAAVTLANRFDLEGHTALLINNEAESETAPLATLEALKRTLQALATHMDVDEDVLFLFLSSHGSAEHELSIEYGGLPLHQLTPADVSAALDAAGIRWRIVVVSACYSGAFIDALRSDTSIVITAASADRSSFGCSDENELTYFGDAYFKQGLAATPDFSAAFDIARRAIEKREHDEQLTPSQPQIYVGSTIRKKLAQLPATDLIHARLDPSSKRASI